MKSLARRGVRTTVAVAGLAALGVGLATPAFAAPNFPEVSGVGNNSTTVPSDQAPSDTTPAPDATTPEAAAATTPSTDPTSALPVGVPNVQVTPVSNVDPGSAMQALDSAGRFG